MLYASTLTLYCLSLSGQYSTKVLGQRWFHFTGSIWKCHNQVWAGHFWGVTHPTYLGHHFRLRIALWRCFFLPTDYRWLLKLLAPSNVLERWAETLMQGTAGSPPAQGITDLPQESHGSKRRCQTMFSLFALLTLASSQTFVSLQANETGYGDTEWKAWLQQNSWLSSRRFHIRSLLLWRGKTKTLYLASLLERSYFSN